MKVLKNAGLLLGLMLAMSLPALAGNYVVYVGPPSGVDDTAVLQGALDVCVQQHPTGCTVQLDAGTYKTKQLLASNFRGAFRGKGMDVTIVDALPGFLVDPYAVSDYAPSIPLNPPGPTNPWPCLLTFVESDVTVSDLTLRVTAYEPVSPWWSGTGVWVRHLLSILAIMGESSANGDVERVAFQGGSGTIPGAGVNVVFGLIYWGLAPDVVTGTLRASSNRLRNVEMGMQAWGAQDARITIGGSPGSANDFDTAAGVFTYDLENSLVEVSHNRIRPVGIPEAGVWVLQAALYAIQEPSQFLIRHNTIEAVGGNEDGIWVLDLGPTWLQHKTADVVVSGNTIQVGAGAYSGIELVFTEEAVVSNNRISGTGQYGVDAYVANGCALLGNNVENTNASVAPVGLLWSDDCTVVGGNNQANVLDLGSNNTLVGVNNMEGNPPSEAIQDAMQRRLDLVKSFRRQ